MAVSAPPRRQRLWDPIHADRQRGRHEWGTQHSGLWLGRKHKYRFLDSPSLRSGSLEMTAFRKKLPEWETGLHRPVHAGGVHDAMDCVGDCGRRFEVHIVAGANRDLRAVRR